MQQGTHPISQVVEEQGFTDEIVKNVLLNADKTVWQQHILRCRDEIQKIIQEQPEKQKIFTVKNISSYLEKVVGCSKAQIAQVAYILGDKEQTLKRHIKFLNKLNIAEKITYLYGLTNEYGNDTPMYICFMEMLLSLINKNHKLYALCSAFLGLRYFGMEDHEGAMSYLSEAYAHVDNLAVNDTSFQIQVICTYGELWLDEFLFDPSDQTALEYARQIFATAEVKAVGEKQKSLVMYRNGIVDYNYDQIQDGLFQIKNSTDVYHDRYLDAQLFLAHWHIDHQEYEKTYKRILLPTIMSINDNEQVYCTIYQQLELSYLAAECCLQMKNYPGALQYYAYVIEKIEQYAGDVLPRGTGEIIKKVYDRYMKLSSLKNAAQQITPQSNEGYVYTYTLV